MAQKIWCIVHAGTNLIVTGTRVEFTREDAIHWYVEPEIIRGTIGEIDSLWDDSKLRDKVDVCEFEVFDISPNDN